MDNDKIKLNEIKRILKVALTPPPILTGKGS